MSEKHDCAPNVNDRRCMIWIKYTTKSGDSIDYALSYDFEIEGGKRRYELFSFDRWFNDRLQHEGGWFPYKGGRIHADALLKVEEVRRVPVY